MSKIYKITHLVWVFFYTIIGWLIIVPICTFIPRKKNLIVCIGRDDGKFMDNIKYFYLYLNSVKTNESIEFYFLTSNKEIYDTLNKNNLPVLFYPSAKAFQTLIKTHIVVVDTNKWLHEWKFFFLRKTKKIQLWHGPPLKKVGKRASSTKNIRLKKSNFILYNYIRDTLGSFITYNLFSSTSDFLTENVFKKTFKAKEFVNFGQPRNDIISESQNPLSLIGADNIALSKLKNAKSSSKSIIFYAPTFREHGRDPIMDKAIDFENLLKFSQLHNTVFIFKFHPNVKIDYKKSLDKNLLHDEVLIIYDTDKDLYPLLEHVDILVTDYSSIYMDFLFFNKPILFYCYDLKRYVAEDRELDFDYDTFTPGIKCYNQKELELQLAEILKTKNDDYKLKRENLLRKIFDYRDRNASKRIFEYIKKIYINS